MQTHVIGVCEARNKLFALLEEVRQGDEVVITLRSNHVARLVPFVAQTERAAAEAALDRIVKRSEGVTLGGSCIHALVNAGR